MTHKLFYVDFFFAILFFLIVLNFSYRFLNVRIIFIMSSLKLLSVGSTVSVILKSASVDCFCFHYGPSILLICISDHFLLEVKYCIFCAEDCWVLLWFLKIYSDCVQMFSSVQSLSHVQLFATTWIAACQASLSITNSRRCTLCLCNWKLAFKMSLSWPITIFSPVLP